MVYGSVYQVHVTELGTYTYTVSAQQISLVTVAPVVAMI